MNKKNAVSERIKSIDAIRRSSRQIVRLLGFMQPTLAATNYPPSSVHTIIELAEQGELTAAQIAEILGLEKSSVSRMLAKLIEADEIEERPCDSDGRAKILQLSRKGINTFSAIQAYGREQVESALQHISTFDRDLIKDGLESYANALLAYRSSESKGTSSPIEIKEGYFPGIVGRITQMHAQYYSANHGFGEYFERQVSNAVSEFTGRLGSPINSIWTAQHKGKILGSIAIDGEDLGNNHAHLRWFIVDDGLQGAGIGKRLLEAATSFCDTAGFEKVTLWTFKGLDAARRLYESHGFVLKDEYDGNQWGSQMTEQRFERAKR
ncbi:helix-turn-helix domain-containing GNAT family N-acetyltransferase [Pseudomonas sp. D1-3]